MIKENEYYPKGLGKKQIVKYYKTVATDIASICDGRDTKAIKPDGYTVNRNVGYANDVINLSSKGYMEFIPSFSYTRFPDKVDKVAFHLKPLKGITWQDTLDWTATIMQRAKDENHDRAIVFDGDNGFYIWFGLLSSVKYNDATEFIMNFLSKHFPQEMDGSYFIFDMDYGTDVPQFLLDLSYIKPGGGVGCPLSLNRETGLILLPVDEDDLSEFSVKDAIISA